MASCPACHADLDGSGTNIELLNCPFCGEELSRSSVESAEEEESGQQQSRGLADGQDFPPQLPKSSKIEIVEADQEHLVLHLPPGGKRTRGIGVFALMWNGFMCVFTPPWFFAAAAGEDVPLYIIIPFLALFWMIGLGFAYAWCRMKFMRTYLFLDRNRIVLQQQLFGRKSVEEYTLSSESSATLNESYRVNDEPVYRVDVDGEEGVAKFGTRLGRKEKDWLVKTINITLGQNGTSTSVPKFCSSCGSKLIREELDSTTDRLTCPECGADIERSVPKRNRLLTIPELRPAELPWDSAITINEHDIDLLRLSIPLFPAGRMRTFISLGVQFAGCLVAGVAGKSVYDRLDAGLFGVFDWIFLIVPTVFTIGGVALWIAGVAITRGRITIQCDADWLVVQWHWTWIGYSKRFATVSVESVQLSINVGEGESSALRKAPRKVPGDDVVVPTIHVGDSFVPLTTMHSRETALQVAGLIKTQLASQGVRLIDD